MTLDPKNVEIMCLHCGGVCPTRITARDTDRRQVGVVMEIVKEILGYLDDWDDDDPEPYDYTGQIRPLVLKIEHALLNNNCPWS